jgi:hypothetical protein
MVPEVHPVRPASKPGFCRRFDPEPHEPVKLAVLVLWVAPTTTLWVAVPPSDQLTKVRQPD